MESDPTGWWIVALLAVCGVLAWGFYLWLRRRRVARLYTTPLPDFALAILQKRVPLYRRLPSALRERLHGHVHYFLDDKSFVGCNGLKITDEIRLTIAGNACLLVLNRPREIFSGFSTILVYPDTYVVPEVSYDGLVETHEESVRLGESWERGPVVLSWMDVLADSHSPEDGHNVVLHEFAHKLDEENPDMDGLPVLRNRGQYAEWAQVLSREFEAFLARVERDENDVIDDYGAVSPAEFFAVVTETFFEKPRQMREILPELYRQLQGFYQLDPAAWELERR